MNLAAFEDHLSRHGGDLALWPSDSRADAIALLDTTPQARALLRAMEDVESWLRVRSPAFSEGAERVAAVAMRHRQVLPRHRLSRGAGWSVAAGLVLFFGCVLGGMLPQQHDDNPEVVLAASLDATGATDVD